MTVALNSSDKIANIVSVDNAPIDAILSSDFPSYIRGMKKVDRANVVKLAEADKILQDVEKVRDCRIHKFYGSC
jgi:hypothetical protein